MIRKVLGWFSAVLSPFAIVWMMVALPSLKGLDGPDSSGAQGAILSVFGLVCITLFISGIMLIKSEK